MKLIENPSIGIWFNFTNLSPPHITKGHLCLVPGPDMRRVTFLAQMTLPMTGSVARRTVTDCFEYFTRLGGTRAQIRRVIGHKRCARNMRETDSSQ